MLFFSIFDPTLSSSDDLIRAVEQMELDLETLEAALDLHQCYAGWLYWLLYLKGYCQYAASDEIGPGNIYYDYLLRHPDIDPGIAHQLRDAATAQMYVARQYRDMDRCRHADGNVPTVDPLLVLSGPGRPEDQDWVFEMGRQEPIFVRRIDGWHRLFAAKLFGITRLPCEFVQEEDVVRPMYGEIEDVNARDSTVEVKGWCIDRGAHIDGVELRAEGMAQTSLRIWSEEAARAFPGVPPEAISEFVLESKRDGPPGSSRLLELVALRDLLPVGHMSVRVFPDLFEERNWPHPELARRLWGTENPRVLSIRGSNCAYDLLTPVGRYRSLDSYRSVLDWGCGAGLLQPFMRHYLPNAEITGIDFDQDAVQWCREAGFSGTFSSAPSIPPTEFPSESFDLVLGHSALTRLDREEQRAWLEELNRLMKTEGMLPLSVNGELVSTLGGTVTYQSEAFTRRECERLFDVVLYEEGGIFNQQDLIILRKS